MPMTDLMTELSFCSVRFHWMLVALAVRLAAHPLAHLLRCWLVDYLSFLLFFRSRASVSGNFPVSLIILLVSPSLLFSVSGCSMYKYFLRVRPVESTLYMTKYFGTRQSTLYTTPCASIFFKYDFISLFMCFLSFPFCNALLLAKSLQFNESKIKLK